MQQHLIKIKANNQPTTLEQLLRVVRFRGFKVDRISMNILPQDQALDIQVSVKSKRPIHLLENQLMKLVDINQVYVEQAQAARAHIS
ncbi:acetolactate synthase 2 small subunit [Aliikangiella coralliicola]|uniref:Acetolactate synthase 2 small subunit n=1 Tax=Aliikangiella coralliicola TaxID=2592383 RepID=A0A545U7L3_9GAMM|nr:acetolactate synthase 2 small subunit [Aliikangiella coralliicola]TQV85460.1 acetolactate synthase 2 small subunit [Aliikangiella coralliicola]